MVNVDGAVAISDIADGFHGLSVVFGEAVKYDADFGKGSLSSLILPRPSRRSPLSMKSPRATVISTVGFRISELSTGQWRFTLVSAGPPRISMNLAGAVANAPFVSVVGTHYGNVG